MARTVVVTAALLLLGCGGTKRVHFGQPDMPSETRHGAVQRLTAASASHDASAIAAQLETEVVNGGLWFPDSTCQARFGTPGTVAPGSTAALAACLAGVTLTPAARQHPYSNVAILTYEPGIELEVLFDLKTQKLRWIGFAARRGDGDMAPTVSQAALEAIRVDPVPVVLDAATLQALEQERTQLMPKAKEPPAFTAWFKLCIDPAGGVTSLRPYAATSLATSDAFAARLTTWRFQPFLLGGTPAAVCALVLLEHRTEPEKITSVPPPVPPAHADAILLPARMLGELTSGTRMIIPDAETKTAIYHAGILGVATLVTFCLADDGRVDWVVVTRSSGYAAYDRQITQGVSQWRYDPPVVAGKVVPICSTAVFVYTQR